MNLIRVNHALQRRALVSALALLCLSWPLRVGAQQTGDLSEIRRGYVQVGADSLYFEEAGAGPAVILVHDGLVHHGIWDEQMPVLSREFRVIRYDRRGYGASLAPTERFSNLDDLDAVMAHLGVQQACLVAMSAGGRLSVDFALAHPERVRCLLLVGAVVSGFPFTSHFYTRGGHLPQGLPLPETRGWYAAEDPYTIDPRNHDTRERVKELVARYPTEGRQGEFQVLPAETAVGRLGQIHVPTLVLVGESDIPDVHAHAGAIAAGIPGAERDVIPEAGHLIPVERPAEFNRRALEFLRRNNQ